MWTWQILMSNTCFLYTCTFMPSFPRFLCGINSNFLNNETAGVQNFSHGTYTLEIFRIWFFAFKFWGETASKCENTCMNWSSFISLLALEKTWKKKSFCCFYFVPFVKYSLLPWLNIGKNKNCTQVNTSFSRLSFHEWSVCTCVTAITGLLIRSFYQ